MMKKHIITISCLILAFQIFSPLCLEGRVSLAAKNIIFLYETQSAEQIAASQKLLDDSSLLSAGKCPFCERFNNPKDLRRHIVSAHLGQYFKCNSCKIFVASTERSCTKHQQTVCAKVTPSCEMVWLKPPANWGVLADKTIESLEVAGAPKCWFGSCSGSIFATKGSLKDHIASRHMGREYGCNTCTKKIKKGNLHGYYEHVQSHHKADLARGFRKEAFLVERWLPQEEWDTLNVPIHILNAAAEDSDDEEDELEDSDDSSVASSGPRIRVFSAKLPQVVPAQQVGVTPPKASCKTIYLVKVSP